MEKESDSAESFQLSPIATTIIVVVAANWLMFFATSMYFGGDALGTIPSQQGFVVESHGNETAVSEKVWLFSLYYPFATLTISPIILLLLFATQLHKTKSSGPARYFVILFLLLWAAGWYYSIIRKGGRSIHDYINMDTSQQQEHKGSASFHTAEQATGEQQ